MKKKWKEYLAAGFVILILPLPISAALLAYYVARRKEDGSDNSTGTEEVPTSQSKGTEGSNHSEVDSDGYG